MTALRIRPAPAPFGPARRFRGAAELWWWRGEKERVPC